MNKSIEQFIPITSMASPMAVGDSIRTPAAADDWKSIRLDSCPVDQVPLLGGFGWKSSTINPTTTCEVPLFEGDG